MLKPTPQALADAVNALYRIRAIEGPPDAEGNKTVWHQCALGAELVSTVNERRHVIRQELTLLHSYFTWTPGAGMATGVVLEDGAKAVANAGPITEMDPELSKERLSEALAALAHYSGEDKYIRHLLRVMALARDGLASDDDEDSVTGAPVPAAGAGSEGGSRRWLYAAAALVALGAAVVAVLR
jgi:hypothetical protein